MQVVAVLPTYNERDNIEHVVRRIVARPCRPRVLVVDDGSPDGTGELVSALGEELDGRVDLLRRERKDGLGRAYAAGFAAALSDPGCDAVVQMDADGSHDPRDIDRLLAALGTADLAVGSRYVDGGGVEAWSAGRRWLSRGGNLYARAILGTGLRDLTGGFKAWRSSLLRRLDATTTASDGYAFQIEMTMRAVHEGACVVEVPIVFHDRLAGSSKMSGRIAAEALLGVPAMRRQFRSRQ